MSLGLQDINWSFPLKLFCLSLETLELKSELFIMNFQICDQKRSSHVLTLGWLNKDKGQIEPSGVIAP